MVLVDRTVLVDRLVLVDRQTNTRLEVRCEGCALESDDPLRQQRADREGASPRRDVPRLPAVSPPPAHEKIEIAAARKPEKIDPEPRRASRRPPTTESESSDTFGSHSDSEAITHIPPVKKSRKRSKPRKVTKPERDELEDWIPTKRGFKPEKSFDIDDIFSSPSPPFRPRARKEPVKSRSRKPAHLTPNNHDEDTETLDKRIEGLRRMLKEFD